MSDLACPTGTGSHPSGEADKSSSSQGDFDPSRMTDLASLRTSVFALLHEWNLSEELPESLELRLSAFENAWLRAEGEASGKSALLSGQVVQDEPKNLFIEGMSPQSNSEETVEEIAKAIAEELGYDFDPSVVDFKECEFDPLPADWRRTSKRILTLIHAAYPAAQARGIEARSDETQSGLAEGESPVANGDAP